MNPNWVESTQPWIQKKDQSRFLPPFIAQPSNQKARTDFGPWIKIYPDPIPNLFYARSLFGRGMIFISQGLVLLLSVKELQLCLQSCAQRVLKKRVIFKSLAFLLSLYLVRLLPIGWMKISFFHDSVSLEEAQKLTPAWTIVFLFLFPFLKLLTRCARVHHGFFEGPDESSQKLRGGFEQLSLLKTNRAEQYFPIYWINPILGRIPFQVKWPKKTESPDPQREPA